MKHVYFFAVIFLLFSACGKHGEQPSPEDPTSVTIDGTKYPVVKIGTQTWMAVNYNGTGGANYNDSPTNDPNYGKLYTYKEAISVKLPVGWRLPTADDFYTLKSLYAYDLKALLSTTGWKEHLGTNGSEFNAFPTGYKSLGRWGQLGDETGFHTTTFNVSPSYEICSMLVSYSGTVGGPTSNPVQEETDRAAVRFVKE